MINRGRRGKAYGTSTDKASGLIRRRIASWLGLWLVVFNLAAAGTLPPTGTAAVPAPSEFLSDHLTICTTGGMVELDHDGRARHASSHESVCGFCLPLMHSGAMAPVIASIECRRATSDADLAPPIGHHRPAPRQGFSPHSARAPPPFLPR